MFLMVGGLICFAQTPTTFNYQSVLRDADGQVLNNKDAEIGIAILQGSATGSEVFSETHSVTTNSFGLINLQIGSVNTTGMETIDWSAGPYFIEISVDGTVMGTSQLLSVPFALHAVTVENDNVEDADADPTNELQQLTLENSELSISDGNSVDLSSLMGTKDTSATNELQDISLSGTNLSISDGSTVDLSVLQDGTGTDEQTLQFYSGNRYLTISNGNSVKLPFIITEKDPIYVADSAQIKSDIRKNTQAIIDTAAQIRAALVDTAANLRADLATKVALADTATILHNEIAVNTQAIIDTAAQIRADMLTSETDPIFNASVAAAITEADTAAWYQDTSATNEIQSLTISNDTIFLSDGGNVKLPASTANIASYGYLYNLLAAPIPGGSNVPVPFIGPNSGVTPGAYGFTVSTAGVYKIDYGVNITAGVGSAIAVAVNNTVDISTQVNLLVDTGQVSGSAMLSLVAGDVITLRNNSAVSITLDAAPGVGAQLNIMLISQ